MNAALTSMPAIPNPIAEAKVVGTNIEYAVYSRQSVEKGNPAYIMGRSDLAEFAACPKKWLLTSDLAGESTEATEWGTLMDCLVLTPGQFKDRFAVCPETYPDTKTKEPKPWTFAANFCKDWKLSQGDKTIIKAQEYGRAQQAVKALDQDSQDLIAASERQVMVIGQYTDKETELTIPLKGLIDLVPKVDHPKWGTCLADLKTTSDASPRTWARQINQFSLNWQAALYLDLYTKAHEEDRNTFRHIVQENKEPFITGRRILSVEFVEMGRRAYLEALRDYCQCLKSNIWPDYETQGMCIDGWSIAEPEAWMVK